MNYMEQMFVKTFSRGAMTIPKKVRDNWGVTGDVWLELSYEDNQLTVRPVSKAVNSLWTKEDEKSRMKARKDWAKRLNEYDKLLENI